MVDSRSSRDARTHADVAGVIEDVSRRALALVSAQGVDANAVEAHVRPQLLALVHVLAHLILRVESHARRTYALRSETTTLC